MEQLCFDFFKSAKAISQRHIQEEICRCAMKWFMEMMEPTGIGVNVPTRVSNIKVDLAMFWSKPQRIGKAFMMVPRRTAAVVCAATLEQCWVNCGNHEQLFGQLKDLRRKMDDMESAIRCHEPQLRDSEALFEEFAIWDYSKSCNKEYQQMRAAYHKIETGLFEGSRFDKVAASGIADELYLVVPAGMIQSEQLFHNWGILEVGNDRQVKLVCQPGSLSTRPEARIHLVQNIASAAAEAVRFYAGLKKTSDGTYSFVRRPRRWRKADDETIDLQTT